MWLNVVAHLVSNLIAKCGIDCRICPWGPYPRKNMSPEDFENFRKDAKAILGYMPIQTPCATCQTPDEKIPKKTKLPNRRCLIRQCVDKTGVRNCAYCSRFPCETLKATSNLWTRKNIEKKLGRSLSEEEYHVFVEPFEGVNRLSSIRNSLRPEQIVEPAKAPKSKTKIFSFPQNLVYPKEKAASFQAIHSLLIALGSSTLGMSDTDTFAQFHNVEKLRAHVLRFLWILGRWGRFEPEDKPHLMVDSETYEANRGDQKRLAIWSFVRDNVFEVLSQFGVCCQRVAFNGVKEEDLVTGTGYMRSKGWFMTMYFEKKAGGADALKSLQEYALRLEKKYDKKAFKHFQEANMNVFAENINWDSSA